MGCDIHLYVEMRCKLKLKTDNNKWFSSAFRGQFSDRVYGMFAVLAGVRSCGDLERLPIRGIPKDLSYESYNGYYKLVMKKGNNREPYDFEYSRADVARWIKNGYSNLITKNGQMYCSDPDAHSENWCTALEMKECVQKVFYRNGAYEGAYIQWLGLAEYMLSIEATGEFEVRAVFWFDN